MVVGPAITAFARHEIDFLRDEREGKTPGGY